MFPFPYTVKQYLQMQESTKLIYYTVCSHGNPDVFFCPWHMYRKLQIAFNWKTYNLDHIYVVEIKLWDVKEQRGVSVNVTTKE